MQVASGSVSSSAKVIAGSCAAGSERLWSVVVRDEGFSLVAVKSGLSLAVGDSVSGGEPALQLRDDDGSRDQKWQFAATSGGAVVLQAKGTPGEYVALANGVVRLASGEASAQPWKLLPGLADPTCVSFEVAGDPGRYLRHRVLLLWAEVPNNASFQSDATFCFRAGLSAQGADIRALESLNFAGRHVTGVSGGQLQLEQYGYDDAFRAKATWIVSGQ